MYKLLISTAILVPLLGACGASIPPPTQRLADAQSATRSARELGANNEPAAQLSLKLADEQISQAQKAIGDGDNKRAESLLVRAKADAELAVAQSREKGAKIAGQVAVDNSAAQETTNYNQGAEK
jgi:hypothetical protein